MKAKPSDGVTVVSCALGQAAVRIRNGKIAAIALGDDARSARSALAPGAGAALVDSAATVAPEWAAKLRAALDGAARSELPLDTEGTPFQRRVWAALAKIPPGQTRTYGELARSLGAPSAARAVGTACGANPVAVLVPCHRAVRADGGLGGYRWGLARKQALLAREAGRE